MVLLCCLNVAVDAHRVPANSMENPYATISETHVGLVIVVGDGAYKLKKPVDLAKPPSWQLEVPKLTA
mgnify:CR=1 FL=1